MRISIRFLSAGLLLALAATGSAALPSAVDGEPMPSLAPLVERVSPAVVNIRVNQTITDSGQFRNDPFRQFFGLPEQRREIAGILTSFPTNPTP